MPTYVYKDTVTGEVFDFYQSMKDSPLKVSPTTGNLVEKQICLPTIIIDSKKPKTLGSLAEKNTKEMTKRGKLKPKKKAKPPWWRKEGQKPVNPTGWSEKQKEKYIMEGKKP